MKSIYSEKACLAFVHVHSCSKNTGTETEKPVMSLAFK